LTCKTLNTSAAFVLLGYASLSHAQPVQPLDLNEQMVKRDHLSSQVLLAGVVVLRAFVCYLLSGCGFLFFSGRYSYPSIAQLAERIGTYYPRHVGNLALYVGTAAVLFVGLRAWSVQRQGACA